MSTSPFVAGAQEAVIGAAIGILVASAAQYLLVWRNLRWTWALFPAGLGALLLAAGLYDCLERRARSRRAGHDALDVPAGAP